MLALSIVLASVLYAMIGTYVAIRMGIRMAWHNAEKKARRYSYSYKMPTSLDDVSDIGWFSFCWSLVCVPAWPVILPFYLVRSQMFSLPKDIRAKLEKANA